MQFFLIMQSNMGKINLILKVFSILTEKAWLVKTDVDIYIGDL